MTIRKLREIQEYIREIRDNYGDCDVKCMCNDFDILIDEVDVLINKLNENDN
jgi:hypothetical protein